MARAEPRHGQCQVSTTATRRMLSGLDTRPLGSRPSVFAIREWQHYTNLRAPQPVFRIPATCSQPDLESGQAAAAGLATYEGDPKLNPGSLSLTNTSLLLNTDAATVETRTATVMLASLTRY